MERDLGANNAESSDASSSSEPITGLNWPPPRPSSTHYGSLRHTGSNPSLPLSSSPAKNLETVKDFLTERAGKAISEVEVEGLVSLIDKSTPRKISFFDFIEFVLTHISGGTYDLPLHLHHPV
jgi:hypothetical protein